MVFVVVGQMQQQEQQFFCYRLHFLVNVFRSSCNDIFHFGQGWRIIRPRGAEDGSVLSSGVC